MRYRDNMTPEEEAALMAESEWLDQCYAEAVEQDARRSTGMKNVRQELPQIFGISPREADADEYTVMYEHIEETLKDCPDCERYELLVAICEEFRDWATRMVAKAVAARDNYCEPQDPIRDGWVGSDGRP